MFGVIGGLLSLIGSGVKGFFGVKQSQADIVNSSVGVLKDVTASNVAREKATATIIASEASSGYWLSAVWRPLMMVFFGILIGCYWFGFVPENLLAPMPEGSGISEVFDIVKIGIMGYIPARTIEKIMSSVNVGKLLQKYLK